MCMQTNFGCCLVDGVMVEKGKKRKKRAKARKKSNKKVIYQQKVDFE
ncbi:lipid-A-disaccharide synthase [Caminibacter pacificus]